MSEWRESAVTVCSRGEYREHVPVPAGGKRKAAHWFTRALKTVEDLIAILSNSDDEKNLLEMKG